MPRTSTEIKRRALWGTVDKYCRMANVNRKDLAKRIGVCYKTVNNYTSGRTSIPLDKLQMIVQTLNIPRDEIMQYIL